MSAALQAENAAMRWRMAELEREIAKVNRQVTGAELSEMDAIASRFEKAAAVIGESAPPPLMGENPLEYRRRLIQKLAPYSATFKNTSFGAADNATLDLIEPQIFAAVLESTRNDAAGKGKIVTVTERKNGRDYTYSYGDPMVWMQYFMTAGQPCRLNVK